MLSQFTDSSVYQRFNELKSGIIYRENKEERICLAFKLIASKIEEIDCIVWISRNHIIHTQTYRDYLNKYSAGFRSKLFVFPIECMSVKDFNFLQINNLVSNKKTFCVIDDSLNIKNAKTKRTRELLKLGPKFSYRLILSELPVSGGLVDYYTQIQFINPQILNMTKFQFNHTYLKKLRTAFQRPRRWSYPEQEVSLIEKLRPYIFENEFADYGGTQNYDIYCDLTPKEEQGYQEEKNLYLERRSQAPFIEIIHRFQHMYTICQNKVETLFEILSEAKLRKEKSIIYVKFKDEVNFFEECGWFKAGEYAAINGYRNKRDVIKSFMNKADVLICTYGVDNLGLDIQICNNVIFFSQTFDYKLKHQALKGLAQRQTRQDVKIYNLWVKTGLDEMMRQSLLMKENIISNLCTMISKEEALKL